MNYKFLEDKIVYDGTQLSSHWIFKKTGLTDDSIVSFIGPADVGFDNMVDLADIKRGEPIKSAMMLHFIIEHFGCSLEEAIARQRLFICICAQALAEDGIKVTRKNDDLFVEKRKLSVSIATTSPVSKLIHTGINIDQTGAPVPACGLKEFSVDPKGFGESTALAYIAELASMRMARCKVRAVK